MTSAVVRVGGLSIATVQTETAGPPVIFVHGNSWSSGSFSRQLEGPLAHRFRLIAIDLPGHGRSSRRQDGRYGPALYADVVVECARALAAEDAVFVGHSLGGHVLLEAAPRPALLVRGRGDIRHANSAAAAWLRAQGAGARDLVRASLRGGPGARFAVFRVRSRGIPAHSLLVHHRRGPELLRTLADRSPRWGLTRRQAQVLELLCRGCTNAIIATSLRLAENTVEHHVSALLRRVGVTSRAELVARVLGG